MAVREIFEIHQGKVHLFKKVNWVVPLEYIPPVVLKMAHKLNSGAPLTNSTKQKYKAIARRYHLIPDSGYLPYRSANSRNQAEYFQAYRKRRGEQSRHFDSNQECNKLQPCPFNFELIIG